MPSHKRKKNARAKNKIIKKENPIVEGNEKLAYIFKSYTCFTVFIMKLKRGPTGTDYFTNEYIDKLIENELYNVPLIWPNAPNNLEDHIMLLNQQKHNINFEDEWKKVKIHNAFEYYFPKWTLLQFAIHGAWNHLVYDLINKYNVDYGIKEICMILQTDIYVCNIAFKKLINMADWHYYFTIHTSSHYDYSSGRAHSILDTLLYNKRFEICQNNKKDIMNYLMQCRDNTIINMFLKYNIFQIEEYLNKKWQKYLLTDSLSALEICKYLVRKNISVPKWFWNIKNPCTSLKIMLEEKIPTLYTIKTYLHDDLAFLCFNYVY
jgi:hypothetical protein